MLCIVKWGGELTPAGRVQAEELGRVFRCMYPGGQGKQKGNFNLSFLMFSLSFLLFTFYFLLFITYFFSENSYPKN